MSKALTSIPTLLGKVSLESDAVGETKADYRLRVRKVRPQQTLSLGWLHEDQHEGEIEATWPICVMDPISGWYGAISLCAPKDSVSPTDAGTTLTFFVI